MVDQQTLHVQVMGGLGSRLRVVVAAAAFCVQKQKRLVVHWPVREPSEVLGDFRCALGWLYSSELWQEVGADEKPWQGKKREAVLDDELSRNVHLRTDKIDCFMSRIPAGAYAAAFNRCMKPTEALLNHMKLARQTSRPMVGVYVRKALASSHCATTEWHRWQLQDIETVVGDTFDVYLAHDDESVLQLFQNWYGDRLIWIPREEGYPYNRNGIMKQAADAHMLKRCQWVLGSNHSSYSQHVALIRGATYQRDSCQSACVTGGRYQDMWTAPAGEAAAWRLAIS